MNCFTEEQINRISHLIREIEKLSDVEKLFLYLQLPCGKAEGKSSKYNGTRSDLFAKKPDQETTQTYTWILSHLEVDPSVSLPKQEVYDEYRAFCQANRFEPLCVADFGKAMKHAFPCIKPRRLGQRGSSRYCYSGLRKKYKLQAPNIIELIEPTFCMDNDCSQAYNQIIRDCPNNPSECSLNARNQFNQTNFRPYEVMNLKIDPNHQQGLHNSNVYHHLPSSAISTSINNYNGASLIGGKQTDNSHQLRDICSIQPPLTLNGTTNNNVAIQQQQASPISTSHQHYGALTPVVPQPTQTNVPEHTRHQYGYQSIIQPPGTPDDDDYGHNYQDVPSVNRHLFDTATATTTSCDITMPQMAPLRSVAQARNLPTTPTSSTGDTNHNSNYNYQTSTTNTNKLPHQSAVLNHRQRQQPTHSVTIDHHLTSSSATINNDHPNTTETSELANQPHQQQTSYVGNQLTTLQDTNNTIMSSSNVESCASPFQSPASTPHHLNGNYWTHDIQDYYSDDCLQYSTI